ncbi:hypothetical protein [Romboutsia sp.]|uniref:hypothetical protein n=1 Tax=Romboutsia sp. TaxID=1965302 RepID=UPI003F2E58EF
MSNDTNFNALDISCNTYQPQKPVYMSIRRENFLYMGIGNPVDPYDYNAIASKIVIGTNDVVPPLSVVIPTDYTQIATVYPCGDNRPVESEATIRALRVICGGFFAPVIYSPVVNKVFDGKEQFIGLDQVVDYISPDDLVPPSSDYTIDVVLEDGPHVDSSLAQYIGYIAIHFAPDDPVGAPNGPGAYFFVVHPKAKIKRI